MLRNIQNHHNVQWFRSGNPFKTNTLYFNGACRNSRFLSYMTHKRETATTGNSSQIYCFLNKHLISYQTVPVALGTIKTSMRNRISPRLILIKF